MMYFDGVAKAIAVIGAVLFTLNTGLGADPELPDLAWTERSDWINVKTDVSPAAKGDGKADDTAAIQAALDLVAQGPKKGFSTVYLPPGTYRITKTLHLTRSSGVNWFGHGRNTKIVWDGGTGSERGMYWSNGAPRTRYVGMVWDGRNVASVGHDHASTTLFETRIRYEHMAFVNFTVAGVRTGFKRKKATAETVYENCLFSNCGIGAKITLHNDYNHKFNGCEFRNCGFGIKSQKGHIQVLNTHFEKNGTDVSHDGDQCVSLRRCTSICSGQFVTSYQAPLTIQDCWVSDWRKKSGAVFHRGAPMLVFDCNFTNPPDANAPIRVADGRILTYSNCKSLKTEKLVSTTGKNCRIVEIPPGRLGGSVTSAKQTFFRSKAQVAGKVFDVKVDFGAKGDDSTDDTGAIIRAIDAARKHGSNAIVYFPIGKYKVTKTISVTGGAFAIGGAGFNTVIRGHQTDGPIFAVRDPQDVTLEHMVVSPVHPTIVCAVEQSSSGGCSYVRYDGIYVPGVYWKTEPRPRGLEMKGLGRGDVVSIGHLDGEMHFSDCGRATILAEYTYEGQVLVEGKDPTRVGFLGIIFRLSTGGTTYSLTVLNNYSIVIGDFYNENAHRHVKLSGAPGEPAGQVTIQGARYYSKSVFAKDERSVINPVMRLNNYKGVFSWGHDSFDYWKPKTLPQFLQTGDRPVDIVFISTRLFHSNPLDFQTNASAKLTFIGNTWMADTIPDGGLQAAASALDHLRKLGRIDIWLNHTPRRAPDIKKTFLNAKASKRRREGI